MILLRFLALHMRLRGRWTWRSFGERVQATSLAVALVAPVADPQGVFGSVMLGLWSLLVVVAVGALLGYRRVRQVRRAKGWT